MGRERVPEGWCSHTEGSVPEAFKSGARDGQQAHVRGPQVPGWSVLVEKVGHVVWGECMEAFVSEEEKFIRNTVFDWEPVEMDEVRGDVLPVLDVSENPGC